MALFINMFLPVKLSLMLRYLVGMLLFSWKLPKKEHYWGRALYWSALCLLAALILPILSETTVYITSLFLLESLMAMCVIRLCCKVEWSTALYIAAAVFSA